MVTTVYFFAILNHLCDGDRIIFADSAEELGCRLDVSRFAPFTFINWVETAGDALSTWVFFNKSADSFRWTLYLRN